MIDLPGKILVVEDSPMMRRLYQSVLAPHTESLIFAGTGAEGLDRAAEEPDVGLFIVDINMPEMDGLEFLRRLHAELGFVNAPAVVISTESGEEDQRAAREAGAAAFLAKPWSPDELFATIQDVLSREPTA